MKRMVGAVALAFLLLLPASGCLAARTASFAVTVTIPAYPLLAWIQPDCQLAVTPETPSVDCTTTITAWQPTLEQNGWRLTLSAINVIDPETGSSIPASEIILLPGGSVASEYGQSIDPLGGPLLASGSLGNSLANEQTILTANPGFGNGAYVTEVHFRLNVPADTPAGTYVPNFTIGVSNNAI